MFNTKCNRSFPQIFVTVSVILISLISTSSFADLNSILDELNRYNESYTHRPILLLTYRHISEKPAQTKKEASRIALQQIRYSPGMLFEKEYTLDEYKQKSDFDGIVNQIRLGSVMEQTIHVIFRFHDFEHIVVNSDGSLQVDQKYDHHQSTLSVFESNMSADDPYREQALLNHRNPKRNIQFLFKWCSIFDAEGKWSAEQLNDNRFRISKKSDHIQLILEVEKTAGYLVPTKFVIDKEDAYIESAAYKNYVDRNGVLAPSLIVIDIIPDESAAVQMAGFLGQTRLLYCLE